MSVAEIVFTGGPCGGKTTAMAEVASRLRDEGWRVLVVPEAATMFIEGGVSDIAELAVDPARMGKFQRTLISTQGALRQRYRAMAEALGDDHCVILYDRAECDSAAYVPAEWFTAALHSEGLRLMEVRDRYDAVIHLRSAAVGAAGHYTTENNPARHETAVEAAMLDGATLESWLGHPRLTVVGNYENFDDKINHAYTAVRAALGVPAPLEIEHKYLVNALPADAVLGDLPKVHITQTYLEPERPGTEERIRCYRDPQDGSTMWVHTVKERVSADTRIETETHLDAIDGVALTSRIKAGTTPVVKTRYSFVHHDHAFTLDELHSPITGWVLEIELYDSDEKYTLPEWLGPLEDVTDDPEWSMVNVAER